MIEELRLLGIAGNLRRASYNRGLLRAAVEAAPEGIEIDVFDIAGIPLDDADVDAAGPPEPVRDDSVRDQIRRLLDGFAAWVALVGQTRE